MLAQTAPSGGGGDPLDFLQFGVLGLVILALLFGWLWAKPAVQQILEDKKRAEERLDDALKQWETQVLPMLTEFVAAARSQADAVSAALERMDTRGRGTWGGRAYSEDPIPGRGDNRPDKA